MAQTIRVEQGSLQGVVLPGGVRVYRGVPFARPPLGDLRWRPPQAPQRWDGVRRADTFGPNAPQPPVHDFIGGVPYEPQSEDCLYLNVWTASGDGERRPVMVWFHYGAFLFGGASIPLFDGAALAQAGIVLVTVGHRLGRLGFLAHPALSDESEHGVSGNYGLLDQIRALEWVQENIAAFGGNPGCVTVFGLSAGSMSVNLLMASPLARGLFHRAIGESGALLGPVEAGTNMTDCVQGLPGAERTGLAVAKALGAASLAELRARSPEDLLGVELPGRAGEWSYGDAPFSRGELDGMFPIADGHVVPASPFELFGRGEQAEVPLLTGSVAGEASGMPWMTSAQAFVEDSRAEYGDRADEFMRLFPADQVVASSAAANGDRVFVWQNWTWARLHNRTATSPTFYYHFSHPPPAPPGTVPPGAHHGVEIPYVFRNLGCRDWPWTAYDRGLSETISSYWLNFARSGDPNGSGLPEWPAFDSSSAMRFGEEIGLGPIPRRAHLDFWDAYFAERRSTSGSARLPGGMGNQGQVVRIGSTVVRPLGEHSFAVHELLDHLRLVGLPAPVRLGIDREDGEVYRWIDGDVAVPPYPDWSLTDTALASVGAILRRYHDATRSFRPPTGASWSAELADPLGGSVICHNDVCPENVVFRDGAAHALLDFDLAAPGRPLWDLAATARMWIPLRPPEPGDDRAHLDRFQRLRVLTAAYGLSPGDHEAFVDAIVENKRAGSAFVRRRVQAGQPAFVEMWENRGGETGDTDHVAWLERSRAAFLDALGEGTEA